VSVGGGALARLLRALTGGHLGKDPVGEVGERSLAHGVIGAFEPEAGDADACWRHYWGHVEEVLRHTSYLPLASYAERKRGPSGRCIEVLSLGSGSCGQELTLARGLRSPYRILCVDRDQSRFEEARQWAVDEGLRLEFIAAEVDSFLIEPGRFDLVLTHGVLRRGSNLQWVLEQIAASLGAGGAVVVVDVVGTGRRPLWEDNGRFANALLAGLPVEITRGHRVEVDRANGIETDRREEALSQLDRYFEPEHVHLHGAFMRLVCADPHLATCFDPQDPVRRKYLDFLISVDDAAVRAGALQPLELWGVFRPRGATVGTRCSTAE